MPASHEDPNDEEFPFSGIAHYILNAAPFKLLVRTRGRRISRQRIVSELNFLEHQQRFAPEDLRELFPIGAQVQLQLNSNSLSGAASLVSGTIVEAQSTAQHLLLELRLRRTDEDFEEFLTELRERSMESGLPM